MLTELRTPLAVALEQSDEQALRRLCRRTGIDFRALLRYAAGERYPAPWLARVIADALDGDVAELFPASD